MAKSKAQALAASATSSPELAIATAAMPSIPDGRLLELASSREAGGRATEIPSPGPVVSSGSALVRIAGRSADVVNFEGAVVAFFIDAADVLGVPKSVAAIYGICFASAEPLSFADIAIRLEISQGSISQGLRVLREVGALKVVSQPRPTAAATATGLRDVGRRDYYTPDLELRKLATHFIEERLEKQMNAGRGKLQAIRAAIPDDRREAAKELKARLKYLQTWHDKGRALVPLVKTFLKLA